MNKNLNITSLISLWAVAECGIGGVMHAIKLPFTGIFVGGIAVMCIYLIASNSENVRSKILEALTIVLMVKFLVSPHSPWQAYVAVIFQAYLGILFFQNKKFSLVKAISYSIICFFESASQKILLALIIFGQQFFKAIDSAAQQLAKSLNLDLSISLVQWVFALYVVVHLIAGFLLGNWLPKIENDLIKYSNQLTLSNDEKFISEKSEKKYLRSFIFGLIFSAFILLTLHYILPFDHQFNLPLIFFRSIVISLLMVFIFGPLLKRLIFKKYFNEKFGEKVEDIAGNMPLFFTKFKSIIDISKSNDLGLSRWKYLLLSFLVNTNQAKNNG